MKLNIPWSVEIYGTEPVPTRIKESTGWDMFIIMVNYLINPGTIITAAMGVSSGLTVVEVILVQAGAVLISMCAFLCVSCIGVNYGLSGQMACRAAFGIRGGRFFTSPLRVCCSIYWFAFQTVAGSMVLQALVESSLDLQVTLTQVAFPFALLQIGVAAYGYGCLTWLFRWAFPLKVLCICYVSYSVLKGNENILSIDRAGYEAHWMLIMSWFNAICISMLTMITDAADFTRYQKRLGPLWTGALSGSLIGVSVGAAFGAALMKVVGGEVSTLFSGVLSTESNIAMMSALLLLIVLDNWTINVINLYSGGLSLSHVLEKNSRLYTTLLVCIPSVLLSCFPSVVFNYVTIMGSAGLVFCAITGVLLVDGTMRKWKYDVNALYKNNGVYWFTHGVRVPALCVVMVSLFVGLFLPEPYPYSLFTVFLAAGLLLLHIKVIK